MTQFGIFLSCEEHGPGEILDQAQQAAGAGFESLLLSDHFHPWTDAQGESAFVWSVIGAIASTTSLKVTTGVTCPTVRIHPAIIAQAAATSQLLLKGRFRLGIGSGEALNEHILGDKWPPAATRLEMMEESVEVMRKLWTGENVTHHGRHYHVENARIYSLPAEAPPIIVSAFGPNATDLAAKIGDGFITVEPDDASVKRYRAQGGKGPTVGAIKVCWGKDEAAARKLAHTLWATESLPGQLNQELPTPAHFEQATSLVTEDMVADSVPCGPDPDRFVSALKEYEDAGFDEIYMNQIGKDLAGFLDFWKRELQPRLAA